MKGKRFRKTKNKHIALSILALLTILIVAAGITFSWIEGGDKFVISTRYDTDVQTATKPDTQVEQGVTIDPQSTNDPISMNEYFDRTANDYQDMYFSPVSSDGESFFFPVQFSGSTPTAYRQSDTNDIGTKYINYNFNIHTDRKCYFKFEDIPTFVDIDGATIDTSAFRIMLKSNSKGTRVFTTGSSSVIDTVVKTINSTTGASTATQTVTAYPLSDYSKTNTSSQNIFEYDANEDDNIEVSIWLQGNSVDGNSNLLGKEVRVNMNLQAYQDLYKVKIYVQAPRTDTNSLYKAYGYNTAETYFPYGAWASSPSMTYDSTTGYYYIVNDKVEQEFNFIVHGGSSSYQYPASGSSTQLRVALSGEPNCGEYYTYVLLSDNTWRQFDDTKITVNAYAKAFTNAGAASTDSTSKGTVKINGGTEAISTSKTQYYDQGTSTFTLTATPKSHYTFGGWYTNAACTTAVTADSSISISGTTLTYTANTKTTPKTFYAKFTEDPTYTATFSASTITTNGGSITADDFTGGYITVAGTAKTAKYQNSYYSGTTVTLNAVAYSGYTFKGWFKNPACTSSIGTAASQTVTISSTNTLFYAKFEANPERTISLSATTTPSGTGGTVKAGTATAGSTSSTTAKQGESVTITATASSGYRFVGWYTDSACTTTIGTSYATASQSITIGSSNITYYAKFVKRCTVTLYAVTDGTSNSSTGGTVQAGTATAGASSAITVDYNTAVNLKATAKSSYSFDGFYTGATTGTQVTGLADGYSVSATSNLTYYARFTKQVVTTNIYFEDRSGFTNYYAYVYNKNDESIKYSDTWAGSLASTDSATGLHIFSFESDETDQFRVIVSSSKSGSNQYPGQNEAGLEGDLGKTYLFKADGTLVEFDPSTKYTITITSQTGGSAYINTSGTTSVQGTYGTTATLNATASSGYTFDGFYNSSNEKVSSSTPYTVTIKGNETYTAKFKTASVTTTIYFAPRSGFSNYYPYIYKGSTEYNGDWGSQTAATLDSSTGYYKYSWTCSESTSSSFYVILHNGSGTQYPASTGLSGNFGGTYVFASGSPSSLATYSTVTITFDISSTTWVNEASAVMYLYDNTTGVHYTMTKGTNKWTVNVPNFITSVKFYRCTPTGFGTGSASSSSTAGYWNLWSAGSRGTSTTYKSTASGSGSWQ